MIDREIDILVEGENPKNPAQRRGRSSCFKMAVIEGDYEASQIVPARVYAASTRTLFAEPLN